MDSSYYLFYKKYHQNKINKIIHLFCIPMIVWSFCVILHNFNNYSEISYYDQVLLKVNISFASLISFFYLLFYTFIDYKVFIPMFFYLGTIFVSSYYFNQYVINSIAYAIYVNLFSWIMQFIGHFIFEGNRPALLDSIAQSFLMAPLFSYYEFKDICKSKNN